MNPSQREDVFILSQGASPASQILICRSGDGADAQTDGIRRRTRVILSVFLSFLSPSRPLVYWHHQLNTTSSNICSTNDCVVKSINPQAAQTPGETLSNKTKKKILTPLEKHGQVNIPPDILHKHNSLLFFLAKAGFARICGIPVAQTLITSNLLCYQLPSTMQLMNTMMIAPGGHSSLLIMHSAPHAITNDQTLHIIAHHLADVLRWLGSPHTPHWPSKSLW